MKVSAHRCWATAHSTRYRRRIQVHPVRQEDSGPLLERQPGNCTCQVVINQIGLLWNHYPITYPGQQISLAPPLTTKRPRLIENRLHQIRLRMFKRRQRTKRQRANNNIRHDIPRIARPNKDSGKTHQRTTHSLVYASIVSLHHISTREMLDTPQSVARDLQQEPHLAALRSLRKTSFPAV